LAQERRRIFIEGTVQGVGFRPFIYTLAARFRLSGFVTNTAQGVTIEVQGDSSRIDSFSDSILSERPRLSHPEIVSCDRLSIRSDNKYFVIRSSQADSDRRALVTPDSGTCSDCLAELRNPSDRRYRYPFINCTNCGPRYTIIFDIPYDRCYTTMRNFQMCPDCRAEYDNPSDRRYHAQPNACSVCGPVVWLTDSRGQQVTTEDAVGQAVRFLEKGHILAVKGLGGFHLAVRADNDRAVAELRQRKYRKDKAFAVMVKDIEAARNLVELDSVAEQLLAGWEKPIVLCPKKEKKSPDHAEPFSASGQSGGLSDSSIIPEITNFSVTQSLSDQVAPASDYWGIMLPYTPLHFLLMAGDYPALVMTSGNISDEPIETDNSSALERLGGIADYFLMHDRDIYTSCDDSVVKSFRRQPVMIRRSRGYAPAPIDLTRHSSDDILAVGAELKNTITVVKKNRVFVSQHIGDLKGVSTYESFLRTLDKLLALIDAKPGAVACDMHPAMLSTQFANKYKDVRIIPVQHHHAHAAAVMGEHDLSGPVLALIADGLGYGTDGLIWGCELLLVRRDGFRRLGHLENVSQPGGDAASCECWRMAVSYLYRIFGKDKAICRGGELLSDIEPKSLRMVCDVIEKGINTPDTSSLGRLFDAVSALLGICTVNTYDAQAAIELENAVDRQEKQSYPVRILKKDGMSILSVVPMVAAICSDRQSGVATGTIAARFHNGLIKGFSQFIREEISQSDIHDIVLAGGVFQNEIILKGMLQVLDNDSHSVYFNKKLPVNDGSISFGQAVVADAVMAQGQFGNSVQSGIAL